MLRQYNDAVRAPSPSPRLSPPLPTPPPAPSLPMRTSPQTPRTERQTRRRPNLLADLPDDLVLRVLEGLSATNLCYACMSCTRLHQLEAQSQERLWCALATERWALEHLRWPHPAGNAPLSWAQLGDFTDPWVPRSATDRAGWKHRFAYLRASKSGTTRDAMSRCLETDFEFEFVLRSGQGRASTPCKLFVFRRVIVVVALQEDYWAKGGLAKGAVPTSLELHVRSRADGRRARLFEVPSYVATKADMGRPARPRRRIGRGWPEPGAASGMLWR